MREAHTPYIFSLFWLVLGRFLTVRGSSAYGLSARLFVVLILIFGFCFLVFAVGLVWTLFVVLFSLLYLTPWWAFPSLLDLFRPFVGAWCVQIVALYLLARLGSGSFVYRFRPPLPLPSMKNIVVYPISFEILLVMFDLIVAYFGFILWNETWLRKKKKKKQCRYFIIIIQLNGKKTTKLIQFLYFFERQNYKMAVNAGSHKRFGALAVHNCLPEPKHRQITFITEPLRDVTRRRLIFAPWFAVHS